MKRSDMIRLGALILCILLVLSACSADTSNESTAASTETQAVTMESIAESTAEETTVPAEATSDFDDYLCQYGEGRDRDWEEDILYFAGTVLERHPEVYEDCHWIWSSDDWSQYYMAENQFYDVSLRNEFIAQTRALISRIPELSDAEIFYELQRITALLNDAHTSFFWNYPDKFPLCFKILYKDGEPGIYVVTAPAEQADLLYSRLMTIEGVPAKEITYRMMDYISSENDYLSSANVTDCSWGSMLTYVDFLSVIGVLEDEARTAAFTFLNAGGEMVSVSMDAVTYETYRTMNKADGTFSSQEYLDCKEDVRSYYWSSRLEKENTYYLRISTFTENKEYLFEDYINDIMLELYAAEEPQKVIIDLRGNGGGRCLWQGLNIWDRFNGANVDGIYVLVDGLSASASVIMASQLKQYVDDVVIVGTPAGQPANFYTGQTEDHLPHSDLGFQVSMQFTVTWKDYEYDALMPDITVYQTLEDYVQGIDTVLDYVRSIENQ